MVKALHHTGFVVRDLESSIEFYRDVLGLQLVRRLERNRGPIDQVVGYRDAHLLIALLNAGNGHHLELIQYVNPPPAERPTEERSVLGGTHLAFEVEDIEATHRTLTNNGARKLNPPVRVSSERIACYLQDPDGNWIELLQDG